MRSGGCISRAARALVIGFFCLGPGLALSPAAIEQARAGDDIGRLRAKLLEYQQKSKFYPALRVAKKLLSHHEKHKGKDHDDTLRALQDVGRLYWTIGDYVQAIGLTEEAVRRLEAKKGPHHMETLFARDMLAAVYWAKQDFARADAVYQNVLVGYEKAWGKDSNMHNTARQRYAAFLQASHRYSAAEALFLDVQRKLSQKKGKNDSHSDSLIAGIWMQLAHLYGTQGNIEKAVEAVERALAGYRASMGERGMSQISSTVLWAAQMYQQWGQDERASQLLDQIEDNLRAVLASKERGGSHFELRGAMQDLANLYSRRKQWRKAQVLYQRLLAMDEKKWGKGSVGASAFAYQLSEVLREQKRYKKAIEVLSRFYQSDDKDGSGWATISPGVQLTQVYREMGDYRAAYRQSRRVLAQSRTLMGEGHPTIRFFREHMGILDMIQGKGKRALGELRRAYRTEAQHIARILTSGTESDNRIYLSQRAYQMHVAIALHARYLPRSVQAAKLALTTVLVRKGRLLDAAASSVATLRSKLSKKDRQLLDRLAATRAQVAKLVLAGPSATESGDYAKELARLDNQTRALERQVRRRSSLFRARFQPIKLARVQKSIPADAALVEIVAYYPFKPQARYYLDLEGMRYGAYVLSRSGSPRWFDLGPKKPIDRAVAELRKQLAWPDSDDVETWAGELYTAVIKPLQPALTSAKHILVAPDDALNLVPFAALVDDTGRHLIRRYRFTYLTSGRDLLRQQINAEPKQGTVIIADPQFDAPIPAGSGRDGGKVPDRDKGKDNDSDKIAIASHVPGADRARGRRSRDLRSSRWKRLPGTAREARAIVAQFAGALLLAGDRATEEALKNVRAPRILHLATHGFFLAPEPEHQDQKSVSHAGPNASIAAFGGKAPGSGTENPLLRSGLVLAGANHLASGSEDGILTALEASGLDLWGTQLVVLSACETGVGTASQGDGVYGLRRALTIAGAESLVMSLWQVDDQATRDLMTSYYRRLVAGRGRTEALRLAQLRMLETSEYGHPYYWAGFIPAGAWSPLAR
ncbi:MAG: CHAT domain-containing protein [Proteobacteria bacterium]|nr:CHAT domain-containing protein [Pseudomonadota bacterium]